MKTRIIILLCLILSVTSAIALAAENTSEIPNVGTLVLPSYVEISPLIRPNSLGNTLLANDNEVLRSANLIFNPLKTFDRNKIKINLYSFNQLLNQTIVKDANIKLLSNTPIDPPTLDNEQLIIKEIVTLSQGIPLHMNYYLLNSSSGGVAVMTVQCADGDSDYWKPIIAKMIADIKR